MLELMREQKQNITKKEWFIHKIRYFCRLNSFIWKHVVMPSMDFPSINKKTYFSFFYEHHQVRQNTAKIRRLMLIKWLIQLLLYPTWFSVFFSSFISFQIKISLKNSMHFSFFSYILSWIIIFLLMLLSYLLYLSYQ